MSIEIIINSPKCCWQLANIIGPIINENRFKEIDFEDLELQKWEEIIKDEIQLRYDYYVGPP